jgi:hypothetical protein
LGDDIVIGGKDLGETYLKVMDALGVEVSSHKTHVSTNTYEFAKRWFRNGIEISGLQVKAFQETWKSYPLLFQVIRSYYERGLFPKRISTYPTLIVTLLTSLGMYPRHVDNIARKVSMLHAFYRWIHNGDGSLLRQVMVTLCPNGASIPHETHPAFKHLVFIRYGMAYQVMHSKLVSEVESYLERIPDLLTNDDQLTNQGVIDYDELEANDGPSEFLGYGDIHNHPVSLSLRQVLSRLSIDPRIDINNPDIPSAIEALVIPSIDNIKSKERASKVMIKTNVVAQKFLGFHQLLDEKRWMLEQNFAFENNIDFNS